MKKPQFSLKTLVFVLTLCAVLFGWWADHRDMAGQLDKAHEEAKRLRGITMSPSGVLFVAEGENNVIRATDTAPER